MDLSANHLYKYMVNHFVIFSIIFLSKSSIRLIKIMNDKWRNQPCCVGSCNDNATIYRSQQLHDTHLSVLMCKKNVSDEQICVKLSPSWCVKVRYNLANSRRAPTSSQTFNHNYHSISLDGGFEASVPEPRPLYKLAHCLSLIPVWVRAHLVWP